ncbi:prohead protease inhibitor [Vibrio phage D481]
MSQLTKHADTLTKGELDAFAKEYYGLDLDRRKSKGAMTKALVEHDQTNAPVKPLPWEELLVETPAEETEVTEEVAGAKAPAAPVEAEQETKVVETKVDASFVPARLPFKRDGVPFMTASASVVDFVAELKSGKVSLEQCPRSDEKAVKSILFYIERDGKVLVRETRNSRFIEL